MSATIDQKIRQGFDKEIAAALAVYFKVDVAKIKVLNDETAVEYTLVTLKDVDVSHPKIKMRLMELARHKSVDILSDGKDDGVVELRFLDTIIEELTEKLKAKMG